MESLKKNIVYQTLYQVLNLLIPFITTPYITRVLGAEGVGIYSYTYSIVSYFVLFAKLGIHMYGSRLIATVREDEEEVNKVFWDLFFIHVIISVLALGFYIIYIIILPHQYKSIIAIQVLYIFAEMIDIYWFFLGIEKFKIIVTRNIGVKIVMLIAVFIFVKTRLDVWKYCAIMASSIVLGEIISWLFLPDYIKLVKPDYKRAKEHIVPMFLFFIPSFAISIYKVMDKIMLGVFANTIQVGYYESSEKIINIILSFITAFGTVMQPRMVNLVANNKKEDYQNIINISMKIIMIITIALTFGICGIAPIFTPVFLGEEFESCKMLVVGLALTMPFIAFANVVRTQFLIPMHKDKVFQGSIICGACVNVVVNLVLIRKYGALGAVVGTVLAESIVCIIQAIATNEELPIFSYIKQTLPYTIYGVFMCLIVRCIGFKLGKNILTIVVQILVGGIFYILCSSIYMYKQKDNLWLALININRKRS